jgi:sulfate/thiosulfate transport system substrate-binding protein
MNVRKANLFNCRWWKKFVAWLLTGLSLSLAMALFSVGFVGCSASTVSGDRVELTLVSFAVTRAAYKQIIPQFAAKWQQEHGQRVVFNQSYGGSGSQTRAVIDGLDADIVALALALDVKKLEQSGLIQPGWEQEVPNNSIPHTSVAALVLRPGMSQTVSTWADLADESVNVITANPKTSGGARWNFLALWGSVSQADAEDNAAFDYVTKVFENAPVLPRDARESTDVFFKQEQGDVLINYENEVILAGLNGEELPYVVPDINISIENPVAIVDANVDQHGTREVAEAFLQYLFTPEAQREFAKVGFRPVEPTVAAEFAAQYPPIKTLFTVEDMGGWDAVQEKFFADGAIFDQIQAKIGRS